MDASIDAVRVARSAEGPVGVLVLAAEEREDVLPIFVGLEEASSIARGLDAQTIDRPLTHDLFLDVMEELGGRIDRVVLTRIEEGTFFADLHVQTPRDTVVVDARPSDSLALASRTNAPVEIDDAVMEEGGRPADEFDELTDIREVLVHS